MTSKTRTVDFLQYQLPVIAWAMFIFIASSIPSTKISMLGGVSDKFVHLSVFTVLCWLSHVALFHQPNRTLARYSLVLALCFTSLFGVLDEYHQMFTPGRSVDIYDWVADTAGGLLYVVLMLTFKFYRNE